MTISTRRNILTRIWMREAFAFDNNKQWIKFVMETTKGIASISLRWLRCEHSRVECDEHTFNSFCSSLIPRFRQLLCFYHPLGAFHSCSLLELRSFYRFRETWTSPGSCSWKFEKLSRGKIYSGFHLKTGFAFLFTVRLRGWWWLRELSYKKIL